MTDAGNAERIVAENQRIGQSSLSGVRVKMICISPGKKTKSTLFWEKSYEKLVQKKRLQK